MVVLNQVEHLQEPVRHDITRLKYHSTETYINFSNTLNSTYFPTPSHMCMYALVYAYTCDFVLTPQNEHYCVGIINVTLKIF